MLILLDRGNFSMGLFGYLDRLHDCHCDSIFLSSTIQLRRLCPETQACRRQTCPASHGKGHLCLVYTRHQDERTGSHPCHWHGCNYILAVYKDAEEYISHYCHHRMLHSDTHKFEPGNKSNLRCQDICNHPNDADQYIWAVKLGIGGMCMADSIRHPGVPLVEL